MTDLERELYDLYARRGEAKSEQERYAAEVKQYDNAMSVIVAQLPEMKCQLEGVASFGISKAATVTSYDRAELDQVLALLRHLRSEGQATIGIERMITMLDEARKETSRAGGFYVRPAKERV